MDDHAELSLLEAELERIQQKRDDLHTVSLAHTPTEQFYYDESYLTTRALVLGCLIRTLRSKLHVVTA